MLSTSLGEGNAVSSTKSLVEESSIVCERLCFSRQSECVGDATLHHNRWPKACGMSPQLLWPSALLCAHKRAVVASNARLTALPSNGAALMGRIVAQ